MVLTAVCFAVAVLSLALVLRMKHIRDQRELDEHSIYSGRTSLLVDFKLGRMFASRVWRQAMAESAQAVTVGNRSYPVRRTRRSRLRQVDFEFEGQRLRGLEQNPKTSSRWAQLAREGKKVMQFLSERRYIANVVDGKVQVYGRSGRGE